MAQDELCLDGEEWRDIAGFENYYQVSNRGRVRSLDRVIKDGNRNRHIKGKVLPQNHKNSLYHLVNLFKDGKQTTKATHRLVAEAFIPNPDNLPVVDHIDANKYNNDVRNLRWTTYRGNTLYAIEAGVLDVEANKRFLQENNLWEKAVKVTRHPVIRNDGVVFESVSAAAKAIGCSRSSVVRVIQGVMSNIYGYTFEYA